MRAGERLEEPIDWSRHALPTGALFQLEVPIFDGDSCVRRNHVHVIRANLHAMHDFHDGNLRAPAEESAQHAFVARVEVLDEDERHSRIHREVRQEIGAGFQSAGGSADADDRSGLTRIRFSRFARRSPLGFRQRGDAGVAVSRLPCTWLGRDTFGADRRAFEVPFFFAIQSSRES